MQQFLPEIEYHRGTRDAAGSRMSILIPSWNNLPFLQLCLASIERHSDARHQVIVHVNEGSDGTLGWVRDHGYDHTSSVRNVGVCYAVNAMRSMATTDLIAYANDDMYLCPGWDRALLDAIDDLGHDRFFLSGTLIEPRATGNGAAIQPHDFGSSPDDFREEALLAGFAELPKRDWSGATWPPNVVPAKLWDLVGGYSTEFTPGLYSDPDFSKKLWEAGVREFRGVAASRAYHFMSKTVGRVQRNPGSHQFLAKWGLTAKTFCRYWLRRGEEYRGECVEPERTGKLRMQLWKGRVKRRFSA